MSALNQLKAQTIYNHSTNLIPSRPNNQFASDFYIITLHVEIILLYTRFP